LWQALSVRWAQGASGEVHVFQRAEGVFVNSFWAKWEYPTLTENDNVASIIYHAL
jgi:hypothetical protein